MTVTALPAKKMLSSFANLGLGRRGDAKVGVPGNGWTRKSWTGSLRKSCATRKIYTFDGSVHIPYYDFVSSLTFSQSLLKNEIQEIANKIRALDDLRGHLESDLLRLQEEELELDDERACCLISVPSVSLAL